MSKRSRAHRRGSWLRAPLMAGLLVAVPPVAGVPAVLADSCPLDEQAVPQALRAPSTTSPATTLDNSTADLSNRVAGRYTLCLDDGRVREGRAWCDWSEDRRSVEDVDVPAVRVAGARRSITLGTDVGGPVFQVWGPGRGGFDGGTVEVPTPLARSGVATFSDLQGRLGVDGTLGGRFGWGCAPPPPREAGHTDATITVALTGPLASSYPTTGYCVWVDGPDGRAVSQVDGYQPRVPIGDGRYLGVVLDIEPRGPVPRVRPWFHLSDARWDLNEYWTADGSSYVLSSAPGQASGTVRSLGLGPEPDAGEPPSFLDPGFPTATVSWDCGDPPERSGGTSDHQARATTPGTLTLDLEDAPIASLSVRAECVAHRDEGRVDVDDVSAELVLDGHRARFVRIAWLPRYLLLLQDGAGTPVGEYIAEPSSWDGTQEDDEGWWRASSLTFLPGPGLAPPPLFGSVEPGPFRAALTIDCPVPVE